MAHPQIWDQITKTVRELLPAIRESVEPDDEVADTIAEKIIAAMDDPGPVLEPGRETHRVGVVVFAESTGVDYSDAASLAEVAVRQSIAGELYRPNPATRPSVDGLTLHARFAKGSRPVRVAHVMDAAKACGNGYLAVRPTSKAYRERGM